MGKRIWFRVVSSLCKRCGAALSEERRRRLADCLARWVRQGFGIFRKTRCVRACIEQGMPDEMRDFLQKNVDSESLLNAYDRLAKRAVPRAVRRRNERSNREVLKRFGTELFSPEGYAEDQGAWTKVKLGKGYTMQYAGCEIIAAYNALCSLGRVRDREEEMGSLITRFEKKGLAVKGAAGTSPRELYRYLVLAGCDAEMTVDVKKEDLKRFDDGFRAVIATVYNDAEDIRRQIHTVCIDRAKEGGCRVHNATASRGKTYASFGEAVWDVSGEKTLPICVIGIKG